MDQIKTYIDFVVALFPSWIGWHKKYFHGVKIREPRDSSIVGGQRFSVHGDYRLLLDEHVELFHQQGHNYWPQGRPTFDLKHKTWVGSVCIGDSPNTQYKIVVVALSDDLRPMIEYFYKVSADTGKFVPIFMPSPPDGFKQLDSVLLTLVSKQ